MRIKTHLDNDIYLSSLQSFLVSCAEELVNAKFWFINCLRMAKLTVENILNANDWFLQ